MSEIVNLAVYDLSKGMAQTLGRSMLGIDVEAIYHTGVRVYGYEYFFSDGLQKIKQEYVSSQYGLDEMEVIPMGSTALPEELIDYFIEENRNRFTSETYNILNHNCNNFSDELVFFLTNRHIPEKILSLPDRLISTPLGQSVLPMLESMGALRADPLGDHSSSNMKSEMSPNRDFSFSPSSTKPLVSSKPIQTISSTQVNQLEMDKACLRIWERVVQQDTRLSWERLRSSSIISQKEGKQLIRSVISMEIHTKRQQPAFQSCLTMCSLLPELIRQYDNVAYRDLYYDAIVCLVRQLPYVCGSALVYEEYSKEVIRKVIVLLLTLVETNQPLLKTVSCMGIAFIIDDKQGWKCMNDSILRSIIDTCVKKEDNAMGLMSQLAVLGTLVNQMEEEDYISMIAHALCQIVKEIENERIMQVTLVSLYIAVSKASSSRSFVKQAGFEKSSTCPISSFWMFVKEYLIMSLGFLTESALIPKKSKEIKIDPGVMIGIKSVIAEAERDKEDENEKFGMRKRSRKSTHPHEKKVDDRNPGVEERARRDEESKKLDSMSSKLEKLNEKSKLFDSMQRGDIRLDDSSTIDFKRRREMYDFYGIPLPQDQQESTRASSSTTSNETRDLYKQMMSAPHKDSETLIEDEFGRLRWVKIGSDDHMKNIGSSYRIRQEVKEGGKGGVNTSRAPTSKAAKVKLTWEDHTLSKNEKEYFVEIDNETERRRKEKEEKKKYVEKKSSIRTKEEIAEDMLRSLLG